MVVGVVVAISAQSIGQVQTEVEFQQSQVVASSFHESVVYASEGRSDSATVDLDGGGRFVGVIYGPGDDTDPGAHIEPSIPIYGGLVGDIEYLGGGTTVYGDIEYLGGGTTVYYDHALENVMAVPQSEDPGVGGIPLNRYTAPPDYFYLRSVSLNATAG